MFTGRQPSVSGFLHTALHPGKSILWSASSVSCCRSATSSEQVSSPSVQALALHLSSVRSRRIWSAMVNQCKGE